MATYSSLTERTDLGEGPGGLIPQAEIRSILQDMVQSSVVLQLGTRLNLSTKVTKQSVLSALPTAYWVSGDTGMKQTTEQQWSNKTVTAEELAVIVPIPDNVLADSNYDVWAEIRPRVAEAIGKALDGAVLFGHNKPTSWENAIVTAAIAAGNSVGSATSPDYAGAVNALMAEVEADDYVVNGFAARNRAKARLRGLRATTNELLFQPSLQAGTPATLYGEPIYYSDANGAWESEWVDMIAGDWSKLVIGVRQDITFKLFTEGVISDDSGNVVLNLMQQDSVALRVTARYGYTVANPISTRNGNNTNRYPFAVLEDSSS